LSVINENALDSPIMGGSEGFKLSVRYGGKRGKSKRRSRNLRGVSARLD